MPNRRNFLTARKGRGQSRGHSIFLHPTQRSQGGQANLRTTGRAPTQLRINQEDNCEVISRVTEAVDKKTGSKLDLIWRKGLHMTRHGQKLMTPRSRIAETLSMTGSSFHSIKTSMCALPRSSTFKKKKKGITETGSNHRSNRSDKLQIPTKYSSQRA